MFNRPTVLILGAGASCHFGYPTGQELVDGILSLMSQQAHPLEGKDRRRTGNADDPVHPDHQLWFNNQAFYGNGRPYPNSVNANSWHLDGYLNNLRNNRQTIESHYPVFFGEFSEQCRLFSADFYQTLKSFDPLNIDAFLGLFKEKFEKIGKYWIAKYLLECENTACFDRKHSSSSLDSKELWPPYNQNWYRYLLDALLSGIPNLPTTEDNRPRKEGDEFIFQEAYKESYEKLQESFSNLFVLTFNYDVSLEYFLFSRLSSIPAIGRDFAHYLLNTCAHIHHVYGSLYDPFSNLEKKAPEEKEQWLIESYGSHYKDRRIDERNFDYKAKHFQKWAKFCWDCAANIHTIGGKKHKDKELKQKINENIWEPLTNKITAIAAKESEKLFPKFFFLGFGFDPQNTELIGFHNFFSNAAKKKNTTVHHQMINAYWTNYNNSNALRQKFLSATQFDCYTTEFSRVEAKNSSPRTVYEALTYDFSFL
jgi:hypothetical protein